MKNQQQAEREEQQRIKNLVLNLDLGESEEQDGETSPQPLARNSNIHDGSRPGHEKPTSYYHNRQEKPGKDRGQRVRKLQLSDVDWYDRSQPGNKKTSTQQAAYLEQHGSDVGPGGDSEAEENPVGRAMTNKRRGPTSHPKPRSRNQNAGFRQR